MEGSSMNRPPLAAFETIDDIDETVADLTRRIRRINAQILTIQTKAAAAGTDPIREDRDGTYGNLLASWLETSWSLNQIIKEPAR